MTHNDLIKKIDEWMEEYKNLNEKNEKKLIEDAFAIFNIEEEEGISSADNCGDDIYTFKEDYENGELGNNKDIINSAYKLLESMNYQFLILNLNISDELKKEFSNLIQGIYFYRITICANAMDAPFHGMDYTHNLMEGAENIVKRLILEQNK